MGHIVNVCFHGIGTPHRELEPGEARYWITEDQFRHTLDLISPIPTVRLSFDDGNASDVEFGLRELRERQLRATFFLLAGRLDHPGSVTSAEARELVAAGMTIGTHGMNHCPWPGMDTDTARRELVDARATLEQATGSPVTEAALPLGRYDRRVLTRLKSLGYTRVHSSDRVWAREDEWLQPRFSVVNTDTVSSLRSEVLARPSLSHRIERRLVRSIKRLR